MKASETAASAASSASAPASGPGATRPDLVAVMSRQASFAMQMRHAGLDVVEGRDVDELAAMAGGASVAVVDLVAVEGKRGLVARLSTAVDAQVPLVLISADEVDLALLGTTRAVHIVVPPVRADDVVACVRRVLAERPGRVITLPDAHGGPAAVAAAGAGPGARPDAPKRTGGWAARTGGRLARAGTPERPAADSAALPPADAAAAAALPPPEDWRSLGRRLLASVRAVGCVSAVAQAIAQDVAAQGGADAVVLVESGSGEWEVCGGVGLRTFEWGQRVDGSHWLTRAGLDRGAALLVNDTDLVRNELVGAPLASRRQLVRVHAQAARFMVVAGWSDDQAGRERVALVTASVTAHERALADALELQGLVRVLARQVDGVDAVLG